MSKTILLLILANFLFVVIGESQYSISQLEEEIPSTVCKCMEQEYEKNSNASYESVINNCSSSWTPKYSSILDSQALKVDNDSLSKFMALLPNLISNKILYDCPIVCLEMNKEVNENRLNKYCQDEFTKAGMNSSIHITKACNCITQKFIMNFCNNTTFENIDSKSLKIEKATKEEIIICLKEDLELIFSDVDENKAYELYNTYLENNKEYQNTDIKNYCSCYFNRLKKLDQKTELTIEMFLNQDKRIEHISRKCKKLSKLKK